MNAKLALQIITTIGYYKDGVASTPYNIKEIWYQVFPNRELPKVHADTYMGNDSWVNWDRAKLELYEKAINFIAEKLDRIN